jgi:hypothetical protein
MSDNDRSNKWLSEYIQLICECQESMDLLILLMNCDICVGSTVYYNPSINCPVVQLWVVPHPLYSIVVAMQDRRFVIEYSSGMDIDKYLE